MLFFVFVAVIKWCRRFLVHAMLFGDYVQRMRIYAILGEVKLITIVRRAFDPGLLSPTVSFYNILFTQALL